MIILLVVVVAVVVIVIVVVVVNVVVVVVVAAAVAFYPYFAIENTSMPSKQYLESAFTSRDLLFVLQFPGMSQNLQTNGFC